jgi:hypothetical protein
MRGFAKGSARRRVEKARVALRKVPGALALGLLTSLAAHAAIYGGDHAMGGSFHGPLVEAGLVGAFGLLVLFAALAWSESAWIADGSVVATRLRDRLPSFLSILLAGTSWFAIGEGIEPHHRLASPLALALALAVASWLLRRLARGVADLLARAAVTVSRIPFAGRAPLWNRRERARPLARREFATRRRFARPPPPIAA